MSKIQFPDLSHYNQVDWSKLNVDAVFCKCTQGTNYLDPTYKTNKDAARKKGIIFGSYHFAQGVDYKNEADWYIENADYKSGEWLALDYEIHLADPVTWCKNFLDYVEQKTGSKPFLYINTSTAKSFDWSGVKNPLWLASYGINDGKEYDPGLSYAIHQFTSNGQMPGITGRCDLNSTEMDLKPTNPPEITASEQSETPQDTLTPIQTEEPVTHAPDSSYGVAESIPQDYQSHTAVKNQWQQLWADIVALIKQFLNK